MGLDTAQPRPRDEQFSACARALFGTESNVYSRALETLQHVAGNMQAPLAIVGGLCGVHYHAASATLDIDVVVPRDQMDEFLVEAQRQGLRLQQHSCNGWHTLIYHEHEAAVRIDVVPEGGTAPNAPDGPAMPSPMELGVTEGLGFASFHSWVTMKLWADREKDCDQLTGAIREATDEQLASVEPHLRQAAPDRIEHWREIVQAAGR